MVVDEGYDNNLRFWDGLETRRNRQLTFETIAKDAGQFGLEDARKQLLGHPAQEYEEFVSRSAVAHRLYSSGQVFRRIPQRWAHRWIPFCSAMSTTTKKTRVDYVRTLSSSALIVY
jgi:hypothetical protein